MLYACIIGNISKVSAEYSSIAQARITVRPIPNNISGSRTNLVPSLCHGNVIIIMYDEDQNDFTDISYASAAPVDDPNLHKNGTIETLQFLKPYFGMKCVSHHEASEILS